MGITKQVASIPSYRPASSAGLTSCAKRITPTLTPYLTPILIQNSKCHEKQEHLGTNPEGHCGCNHRSPDRHYDYKLHGLRPALNSSPKGEDGRGLSAWAAAQSHSNRNLLITLRPQSPTRGCGFFCYTLEGKVTSFIMEYRVLRYKSLRRRGCGGCNPGHRAGRDACGRW